MKVDWKLGNRVQFFVRGELGAKATLCKGNHDYSGCYFPHYAGDGFYFVKIDNLDGVYIAHQDDLIKIEEVQNETDSW